MPALVRRPAGMVVELGEHDRADVTALIDADPLVNVTMSARLRALPGLSPRTLGGTLLGVRSPAGELVGAAFCGGLLQPIGGGPAQWRALGTHLAARRRLCSSVVGAADAVRGLWTELEPAWGPARAIRDAQPLLSLHPSVLLPPGHPELRFVRRADLAAYVDASAAMFAEELGAAPRAGDYRERIAEMVDQRRCLAVVGADGRIEFKVDVGAVSAHTCQIQGVWVRPELRGRGLGTAGVAGALAHARTLAPTVSLYVNDFNHTARRVYGRLGMEQAATLATVLF